MLKLMIVTLLLLLTIGSCFSDNILKKNERLHNLRFDIINPCLVIDRYKLALNWTEIEAERNLDSSPIIPMEIVSEAFKTRCNQQYTDQIGKSILELAKTGARLYEEPEETYIKPPGSQQRLIVEYGITNFFAGFLDREMDVVPPVNINWTLSKSYLYALSDEQLSPEKTKQTRLKQLSAISPTSLNHPEEIESHAANLNPITFGYHLAFDKIDAATAILKTLRQYARSRIIATKELGELLDDSYLACLKPEETQLHKLRAYTQTDGVYIVTVIFSENEQYKDFIPTIFLGSLTVVPLVIGLMWRLLCLQRHATAEKVKLTIMTKVKYWTTTEEGNLMIRSLGRTTYSTSDATNTSNDQQADGVKA